MDAWMHNLSNPVQTAHEGALRDILGPSEAATAVYSVLNNHL